jgi:hypothetical protein
MSAYTISASFLYPYEVEECMEGLVTLCIHKKYISNRNVCTSPQHARTTVLINIRQINQGNLKKKRG